MRLAARDSAGSELEVPFVMINRRMAAADNLAGNSAWIFARIWITDHVAGRHRSAALIVVVSQGPDQTSAGSVTGKLRNLIANII